jgi:STE24 endopeptidase
MSLRSFWALMLVVGISAIAWGMAVGSEPVPARQGDPTRAVDDQWYATLPLDPAAATQAYRNRIPPEMRARGESYSDSRLLAFVLRVVVELGLTILFMASGVAARMRDATARRFKGALFVDMAMAVQYFAVLFVVTLPVEIYAGFARPRRVGFSAQSFGAWLSDALTNWGVITVFYVVGALVIYRFIRQRPTQWVLWATGIFAALSTLYIVLTPGLIEPLTNDFKPLADGHQKQEILALAHASGITDAAVVVGDASRQSRLLNAHVSGFGSSARISVDDSTLSHTSDPMLRAVVGHEIGHFVMNHTIQYIVWSSLLMGVGFLLIALAMRWLLRRFGQRWGVAGQGDIAALPLFWGLFLMWGYLSLPVDNALIRSQEHQADLYGLNTSRAPHGLAEFMIHDADVARLQPSTLEYALFFTHPSDAERVMTSMQWRAANLP